jgi:hypothetical protein
MLSFRLTALVRRTFRTKLHCVADYRSDLRSKHGLEIAGHSLMLAPAGKVPIYDVVESLDNCLYSQSTIFGTERCGKEILTFMSQEDCLANHLNRAMYRHAFDTMGALTLVNHADLQIIRVYNLRPSHITIINRRADRAADNRRFMERGLRTGVVALFPQTIKHRNT